ncbi:ArsR family transcriptional regulator [Ruegeria sp. ANG-R]|uniref:ArsR/SmtB family transcription factor n=1 Tax=Ruegeria sp. ANG-R TaxID=1577903 RepID=UPI00057C4B41|nr:winged helix-turn-helix domain-containing protein [Ruegeria sp. ANG-R]KIC38692.1 ArsR family transcriptional regulator [Ruegeria sp. ANG-R]
MRNGPDIAQIAALIGDPARANMLTAMMSGKALTAGELAREAGISPQTASSHLKKLLEGRLIRVRGQGRHKYYGLSGGDVAHVLENLMGLAAGRGHLRTRTGPHDAEMRAARVCYNHLAGSRGVQMFTAMQARGYLDAADDAVSLTPKGVQFCTSFGIDLDGLGRSRAPLCRPCLDWSERETHLAGKLGRALLARMEEINWLARKPDSRIIRFTRAGALEFDALFST